MKEIDYETNKDGWIKTKILQVQGTTFEKINVKHGSFDLAITNPDQKNAINDNLIVIELKWMASLNDKKGQEKIEDIKKDIKKINNKGNQVEKGYILVFNNKHEFTNKFKKNIENYNTNPNLKIRFISSEEKESDFR